jgi:transcriptional regulator with XRE-family HTH domain
MRLLRLNYGISLPELARTINVSPQYLSLLELGETCATETATRRVQLAFERVIIARRERTIAMTAAYAACRERILEFTEEPDGN